MPPIDAAEIRRRFTHHPPDADRARQHEGVREAYSILAMTISVLPESREKSLAITELETSMFWANAAIAREGK